MMSSRFTMSCFDVHYLISMDRFSHSQHTTCQSHSVSNLLTQANIMLGRCRHVTTKWKGKTICGVEMKGSVSARASQHRRAESLPETLRLGACARGACRS